MKGIREAAMSTEEETPVSAWPKAKTPSLFDKDFDSDRYDGSYYGTGYNAPSSYTKYKDKTHAKDEITIILKVQYSDLKLRLTGDGELVDPEAGEVKATEIAYDRIEQLLGKNYESKYSVAFDASDDYYDSFEVEVTLTPNK